MTEIVNTPSVNELHGLHRVKPDTKGRISVPQEWRGLLPAGSTVVIIDTGNYLLLIPEGLYTEKNPELIIWKSEVDTTGRILIGEKLLQGIKKTLPETVGLIAKGNHIELYLEESKLTESIARSRQVANEFQVKLLNTLGNPSL